MNLCRVARKGAAAIAATLSGNRSPEVVLVDQDGESIGDSSECDPNLTIRRIVTHPPDDPFPVLAERMSEWSVSYFNPATPLLPVETINYAGDLSQISVDLQAHPGLAVRVRYEAVDIQGYTATRQLQTSFVPDSAPPEIAASPTIRLLNECASGQGQALTPPVVGDNCEGAAIVGRIVSNNGLPLNPPIDLDADGFATFPPGTSEVQWTATDAAGNSQIATEIVQASACVSAGQSMRIANQVILTDSTGSPSSLMMLGGGLAEISGQANVGDVISRGSVRVDGGATVHGDIVSAAQVNIQNGATVTGTVTENHSMNLPEVPTITGEWPSDCASGLHYNAGLPEPQSAPAGCYSSLAVGSNTEFQFQAGTYFLSSLTIEPQAILVVPEGTFIQVRDQFTFRGSLQEPSGLTGKLHVAYRGTSPASVESSFAGSILAPNARLYLGSGPSSVFTGEFFARDLEIRAGVQVVASQGPGFQLQSLRLTRGSYSGSLYDVPTSESTCSTAGHQPRNGGQMAFLFTLAAALLCMGRRRRFTLSEDG